MLKDALQSLSQLKIPEHTDLSFLVVENDDETQYETLIRDMQTHMNIHYVQEPVAGLTNARNKALDTVTALGVDWMGCVDDDQYIDPDWLVHMVSAIRTYPDTAMFVGLWLRINQPNTPAWYPRIATPKTQPTGAKLQDGVGGNTMIHSDVFSPSGMALRYDPEFSFLGGEDTDFSWQYRKKRGIIRHVKEAKTTEDVLPERNGLAGRLERISWTQAALAKIRHKHQLTPVALLLGVQIVYQGIVLGIVNVALGLFAYPFSKSWGLTRYGIGLRFLARVRGVSRFYFGKIDEPYRNTLGN